MSARPDSALRLIRAAAMAAGLGQRSDSELLTAFLAGEEVAFEALVRRHGPLVLRACRAVTRSEADAEDAFQATFVFLLRQAGRIRDHRSLAGWLFRVARRAAVVTRRAADRRARREAAAGRPEAVGPAADAFCREACSALYAEIDRLPDAYRLPLVLCYLQGLSRDEAADQLGWTLNEVRGRLERGRARLRRRLEARGLAPYAGLLAAVVSGAVTPALVRAATAGAAQPPARVADLAAAISATVGHRVLGALAVAAALAAAAIGLGAEGLWAGQPPPSKEMPARAANAGPGHGGPDREAPERLTLSGRVVDPAGHAVAGAKVWLAVLPGASPKAAGPKVVATTGDDGRFTVAEDGRGRGRHWTRVARVVATADGFGLAWAAADPGADKPVELRLVEDEPVRGRVLTLEGKPVAGARVRVQEVDAPAGPDLSKFLAEAKARERARHEIYHAHFPAAGRLPQPGYAIPGQPDWVETDAEGRFRITGLGRERLAEMRVEGPTIATAELSVLVRPVPILAVPVDPGDSRSGTYTYYGSAFDYAAEPTQPFQGRVADRRTGEPVPGVRVQARHSRLLLEATTDRDGRYRLTGLPPGRHQLITIPAPDQPYHRMEAGGGQAANTRPATVDFPLTRGHWVEGKVVNARTGKPEAGADVWYVPVADEPAYVSVPGSQAWVHEPTTVTAADGSFRVVAFACRGAVVVQGFAAGSYVGADQRPVQGDADSLDPGMRRPKAIPTSPVVMLSSYHAAAVVNVDPKKPKAYTITLDPGVAVKVRVLDPDGKPLAGAGVGGLSTWSLWAPDQKAELELSQYNPDRPRPLVFLHPGKGLGKLVEPKTGDAGPWEVRLDPTGSVTGRLVTEDGGPVANAVLQVSYRLPGQPPTETVWTQAVAHGQVRTDAKGVFRLPNLVGGLPYSIDHQAGAGTSLRLHNLRVQVKPGEAKDLGDVRPAAD